MKKSTHVLAIILICLPTLLFAQDDSKYMAGAVPLVNDKVVFQKEFNLPGAGQEQIYNRMYSWLEDRMQENKNNSRIVYTEKDKGIMAAAGEEYLVFTSTALSLDRTIVNYQITVTCQPAKCVVELERIRYTYEQKEKYTAEEWIVDEMALNKTKTKLVRGIGKFRTKTIDLAEELFESAQTALGISKTAPIVQQQEPIAYVGTPDPNPVTTPPATIVTVTTAKPDVTNIPSAGSVPAISYVDADALAGYKQIAPDKIPGNIIKMLNEDWMLITAGNDEKFNMMTASWGGLGVLYGKPMAICFINPARYTYQLMEKGDTYTFTFYTEAYRDALQYCGSNSGRDADKVKGSGLTPITTPGGSKAFSEAWLIIECRKLVSQSFTPESIFNEKVKEQWSGRPLHKMYIGEIINVWVK